MNKSNYEVEVLVNGRPVKEYLHEGQVYIEGRENQKFQLRIRNNGYGRILAIPTIDGLSVLDGQEATPDSTGYIINGYSSLVIDGWRRSDKEVAEFYFTTPGDAYGTRVGKGGNLGVIGVAVFREKYKPPVTTTSPHIFNTPWWFNTTPTYKINNEVRHEASVTMSANMNESGESHAYHASAADSNMNSAPITMRGMSANVKSGLGTGWGDTVKSVVTEVAFDREFAPDAIFEVFYNTKENLEQLGIDFASRPTYVAPSAFPKFPAKYCQPPR